MSLDTDPILTMQSNLPTPSANQLMTPSVSGLPLLPAFGYRKKQVQVATKHGYEAHVSQCSLLSIFLLSFSSLQL